MNKKETSPKKTLFDMQRQRLQNVQIGEPLKIDALMQSNMMLASGSSPSMSAWHHPRPTYIPPMAISQMQQQQMTLNCALPPIFVDESRLPDFYRNALIDCGGVMPAQLPNTARVYSLLVRSRLSRETLGHIWSIANRTLPGQLTRTEFCACLALVALAQNGQPFSILNSLSTLPIPMIHNDEPQSSTVTTTPAPIATMPYLSQSSVPTTTPASIATMPYLSPSSISSLSATQSSSSFSAPSPSSNHSPLFSAPQPSTHSPSWMSTPLNPTITAAAASQPAANIVSHRRPTDDFGDFAEFNTNHTPTSHTVDLLLMPEIISNGISTKTDEQLPSHLVDKYAAVVDESRSNDSTNSSVNSNGYLMYMRLFEYYADDHLNVWLRCMREASQLLDEACSLLDRDEDAFNRVLNGTQRGIDYCIALSSVYAVVSRIRFSLKTATLPMDETMVELLSTIDRQWQRLKQLLPDGANHSPTDADLKCGHLTHDSANATRACAICLLNVDQNYDAHIPPTFELEYAGRCYHSQCANLWINRCDSLLPALTLPTLL